MTTPDPKPAPAPVEIATSIDDAMPRPVVFRFACLMERVLKANDHKGGWRRERPSEMLSRLYEEAGELGAAIEHIATPSDDIGREAADVANFAMMIADLHGGAIPGFEVPSGVLAQVAEFRALRSEHAALVARCRALEAERDEHIARADKTAEMASRLVAESASEAQTALARAETAELERDEAQRESRALDRSIAGRFDEMIRKHAAEMAKARERAEAAEKERDGNAEIAKTAIAWEAKARAEADALRSALDRIEHEIGSIPRIHDETAEEFRSVALFASEIAQVVLFVARNALAASAPEARVVVLDEQEARNVRVLIHNAPPLGVAQWCGPILARINAAWPPVMGIDLRRPGPSTYSTVMAPEARVWLTREEARAVAWMEGMGECPSFEVVEDVCRSLRARLTALAPATENAPMTASGLTRNESTAAGKAFWDEARKTAEKVAAWPAGKRGGEAPPDPVTDPATPESDAGGKGAM